MKHKILGLINRNLSAQNPARYMKSASWLVLARIASMAVSLIATFYIARSLGPQNFGELSYAQSIIGIFAIAGGLGGVLYRDIVNGKTDESILMGTTWALSLASSLVTTLLTLVYVFILPHDTITISVIGIILFSQLFTPFYILNNVFYTKTDTKLLSISQFTIHVIISILKIVAMSLGEGVFILASIIVIEHILTTASLIVLYLKYQNGNLSKWRFSGAYAKKLCVDSLPFIAISASGMISTRIDQVLIKNIIDTTSVGLYSAAVQLSEVWQFIPGLLITALLPAILLSKDMKQVYRKRIFATAILFIIFGAAVSIFMTIFAKFIVITIYGQKFIDSVPILQIYIWSLVPMTLGFLVTNFLIAENFRRIQVITGVVPMIINILLNFILIPQYGAYGAAIATVVSYSTLPIIPFLFSAPRKALSLSI